MENNRETKIYVTRNMYLLFVKGGENMDKETYKVYQIMQYIFNEMIRHKRMAES